MFGGSMNLAGLCLASFLIAAAAGCGGKSGGGAPPAGRQRDIDTVKEAHTPELMALPGVVGVYVGRTEKGEPCIGVMVIRKTEELVKKIPRSLEGYPVIIDETGEIRPMKG